MTDTIFLATLVDPTLSDEVREALRTGAAAGALLDLVDGMDPAALAKAVRGAAAVSPAGRDGAPPIVAVFLDAWGAPHGPTFDVAERVHDLAAGGEPFEAMLAALETGRSLAAAGINAVIGPDLSTWLDDAGEPREWAALEVVVSALVEGSQAAGVVVATRGVPGVESLGERRWRPWEAARAAGLEWAMVPAREAARALRDALAFDGPIAIEGEAIELDTRRPLDEWRLDVLD